MKTFKEFCDEHFVPLTKVKEFKSFCGVADNTRMTVDRWYKLWTAFMREDMKKK